MPIAIALSFILGVEILKLFYIKTYKQLIIVATLVAIKLFVRNYKTHAEEKGNVETFPALSNIYETPLFG